MAEKKLSPEEIEKMARNCETVFGIEGMEFTEVEKNLMRKFIAGEITREEYVNALAGND